MGVNKVVYSGETLIDLTSDTVDAASLRSGKKAHSSAGESITGTAVIADGIKILLMNLSVATSAWVSDSTYSDYPYRARITVSGCTTSMWPDVLFASGSITTLDNAGIGIRYARSNSGSVDIFASAKPSAALTISYLILR